MCEINYVIGKNYYNLAFIDAWENYGKTSVAVQEYVRVASRGGGADLCSELFTAPPPSINPIATAVLIVQV